MAKKFVDELKPGEAVDSVFSVKYLRSVDKYAAGWRFAFGAADKTGEIEVSYWGGPDRAKAQAVHDSLKEGCVARVQGFVGTWKERPKIDVNEGKGAITPVVEFDLDDFLPKSAKDVDALYAQLLSLVGGIKHDGIRKLLEGFFKDPEFAIEFKRAPGAMQLHHAWLGGLLEHSLSVAMTARAAAANYALDIDLLTAGALLHDIGKMREYEVTTSIKVGEEGMLRGHTVMGEEMVRHKASQTGLDSHMLLKLSHMILSHHGELENGAPKKPMFAEAVLLHYADQMDSKASQFERMKRETISEDFRLYDKYWGEVYLK